MEIEIQMKQRIHIFMEKLIMIEEKITLLNRVMGQLEQEMETTTEDEETSEESSGSDAEIVNQAGICFYLFFKVERGKS